MATAHPVGVFLDFPPIFLKIRFFFGGGFKCTRDFRSHWIKGKSKLNCPRGCADQKFTTVRVLNVAQTHRRFSLVHFPNFHPGILSAFDMANLELRVLSFGRKHPLSEMTLWLVLHNPDRQSEKSEKSESKKIIAKGGGGLWVLPAGLSPCGSCMCAFDFWPT